DVILLRGFEGEVAAGGSGCSVAAGTLSGAPTSDASVSMVDAPSLAVADEEGELAALRKYDEAVEALLLAIKRSRDQAEGKLLYPIFVFTKFDRVDPKVLRRAKLDADPPEVSKKGSHADYAKRLVDRSMPKTTAAIESRGRRGLQFATPSYFFSWVRTEEPLPGRAEKIRLRRSGAIGWEPDYPSDEYLAFLECLAGIAADTLP